MWKSWTLGNESTVHDWGSFKILWKDPRIHSSSGKRKEPSIHSSRHSRLTFKDKYKASIKLRGAWCLKEALQPTSGINCLPMNNHGEVTGAGQSHAMAQLSSKVRGSRPGAALKALGNGKSYLTLFCWDSQPSLVLERKWQLLLSKRIRKSMAQHARDKCLVSSKVNVNDKCFRGGFWLTGGGGVKCTTWPRWCSRIAAVTIIRFHQFKKVEHREWFLRTDQGQDKEEIWEEDMSPARTLVSDISNGWPSPTL